MILDKRTKTNWEFKSALSRHVSNSNSDEGWKSRKGPQSQIITDKDCKRKTQVHDSGHRWVLLLRRQVLYTKCVEGKG